MLEAFSHAFPKTPEDILPVDGEALACRITETWRVPVPDDLIRFWREMGAGYFGERMLYFFGDGSGPEPRDSLIDWNSKDFWASVYPPPAQGGPVFFAENSFGEQLGFRWEDGACIFNLLVIDTFSAFRIAGSAAELFETLLVGRYAVVDEIRYRSVRDRMGLLRPGMHYAPFVSPLVGGSGEADNFCFETPNVHFRTAIATWQALNGR